MDAIEYVGRVSRMELMRMSLPPAERSTTSHPDRYASSFTIRGAKEARFSLLHGSAGGRGNFEGRVHIQGRRRTMATVSGSACIGTIVLLWKFITKPMACANESRMPLSLIAGCGHP
jgi:hypothetical protein